MSVPTAWNERCRLLAGPIIEACAATSVLAGPAALAREIGESLPDWSFREVLCRGGWYRLGGVVDADGQRIGDVLEDWAAAELEVRHQDLAQFDEDYAGSGYRATQHCGRTRYFVAQVAGVSGGRSGDFLQLEIEELQETLGHPLFGRDPAPSTLDELVDARCAAGSRCAASPPCGTPVEAAHYRFRRLTHVGDLLDRMRGQAFEAQPIHRFVADWEASSAGAATAFCNHWALALREHLDRYRQSITKASPIAARNGAMPPFAAREGTSGLSLRRALQDFDHAAGYPLAWYFSLLTSKAAPHWLPVAVASDAAAGFSYLPERDLVVIKQWLHKPYAF